MRSTDYADSTDLGECGPPITPIAPILGNAVHRLRRLHRGRAEMFSTDYADCTEGEGSEECVARTAYA